MTDELLKELIDSKETLKNTVTEIKDILDNIYKNYNALRDVQSVVEKCCKINNIRNDFTDNSMVEALDNIILKDNDNLWFLTKSDSLKFDFNFLDSVLNDVIKENEED